MKLKDYRTALIIKIERAYDRYQSLNLRFSNTDTLWRFCEKKGRRFDLL